MSSIEPIIQRNTLKWELAENFNEKAKDPEIIIKQLFESSLISLEKNTERRFDDSVKKRVWHSFSPEYIRKMKDILNSEFIAEILVYFKDNSVDRMNDEFLETGRITNEDFLFYKDTKMNLVVNNLIEKAQALLSKQIIPAIITAFEEEGINLKEKESKTLDLNILKS